MQIRVSAVQTSPRFLNRDENLAEMKQRILPLKSDLIVLPELASSGYNFRHRRDVARVAEPAVGGPTSQLLQKLARQKNCAIVAGFPEKHGARFFNSALFVTPKSIDVYRKVHLFWNEKKYFSPGNLGLRVFSWKNVPIGVMICFDWFFPEAMRTLALQGAQVVAHPSNLVLPWAPRGMRVRSLENHVFSITSNRVGRERKLTYIGQSQILDIKGRVLAHLGTGRPGAITAKIDPAQARNKKINPMNDLFEDRRPHDYR